MTGEEGKFITLEGGEGSGKSSQIFRLAEALTARGVDVVTTREPGGAPGADQIRRLLVEGATDRWDPMSEALLHFAARHDHLRTIVRPALAAGKWVVSDRFADSTMAYQGYGHGLGREPIAELYRTVVGDFVPDLTLILDLEVGVGLARAGTREAAASGGETRYERMGREFHERVRAGFLEIAAGEPDRCRVIDASGSIDEVAASVFAVVEAELLTA